MTDVRAELRENDSGGNQLVFHAACGDGKRFQIVILSPYDPLCADADEPEFPLRGVYIFNELVRRA